MKLISAVIDRITFLMNEKNLKICDVYKLTGVPASTLSTILNKETKSIKLDTIFSLCDGLGIELYEFFNCPELKRNKLSD